MKQKNPFLDQVDLHYKGILSKLDAMSKSNPQEILEEISDSVKKLANDQEIKETEEAIQEAIKESLEKSVKKKFEKEVRQSYHYFDLVGRMLNLADSMTRSLSDAFQQLSLEEQNLLIKSTFNKKRGQITSINH